MQSPLPHHLQPTPCTTTPYARLLISRPPQRQPPPAEPTPAPSTRAGCLFSPYPRNPRQLHPLHLRALTFTLHHTPQHQGRAPERIVVSSSHPLKYPAPAEPTPAPSTRAGCLLSLLPRGTRPARPRPDAYPHHHTLARLLISRPPAEPRAHPTSATATATPPSSRTPPPHNAAKRPNPIPLSYQGVNHGTPAEPRTTTSTGDHRGTRLLLLLFTPG